MTSDKPPTKAELNLMKQQLHDVFRVGLTTTLTIQKTFRDNNIEELAIAFDCPIQMLRFYIKKIKEDK